MPGEINYPGVYVEEVSSNIKPIEGVPTSTAAFAGWSAKGPTHKWIKSWSDYQDEFGGLDTRSMLGFAVSHFFDNGGREAHIIRIGDESKVLEPNTAEFEDALFPPDGRGGLYQLDEVDIFNFLCVPGESSESTVVKLQNFCRERRAFAIIDCPETAVFDDLKNGPGSIAGDDSINCAYYFPWIIAADPQREFPPCGFVAGIFARIDETRGVWKAPAGAEASLNNVLGVDPNKKLTEAENGVLNRKGVNCIRMLPNGGTVVWGARTLHGRDELGSDWKYVPVRRLFLYIEESIVRGIQWAVFEPNDEPLWAKIRLLVGNFLLDLWRKGALLGTTAKDAYFVRCGRETTTQSDIDAGVVNIEIGFAPLKPAEFVILRLQQLAGQIQASSHPHIDTLAEFIESTLAHETEKISAHVDQLLGELKGGLCRNAIFIGEKGTGKTKTAGVIASQLGSKLYRVDLSSVVSKYIGETEKNLDILFAAAKAAGVVLLFDEADALFGKRSDVKDAHDRYANIEVSYLLDRLENYDGVAILATNMKENIDPAFLRRLRHHVEFPLPIPQE